MRSEENASFCALLEYSKGKQSKENGGFVGIRFISEPMLKSNRLFLMRKKAK